MISLNSSDSSERSIAETREDRELEEVNLEEEQEEEDDGEGNESNSFMWAALAAAAWMSRGEREAGRGREAASWGKLRMAELPLMLSAATSWARAAISGVRNVPSQMRDFFLGSRISDTHFPQFLMRTPRYTGCLLVSRPRFAFLGSGSASGLARVLTLAAPAEEFGAVEVVRSKELDEPVAEEGDEGGDWMEFELVSWSEFDSSAIDGLLCSPSPSL